MTENEQVISLYNEPDIKKITRKAVSKFSFLGKEELEQCKLIGIWKALSSKRSDIKFTTNVFNNTVWECKTRAKDTYTKDGISKKPLTLLKDKEVENNDHEMIDILDELSQIKDGDMIIEKVFHSLTLSNIGEKKNASTELVRQKIEKAMKKVVM